MMTLSQGGVNRQTTCVKRYITLFFANRSHSVVGQVD